MPLNFYPKADTNASGVDKKPTCRTSIATNPTNRQKAGQFTRASQCKGVQLLATRALPLRFQLAALECR
eukprot:4365242-Pleurochrysis_carterae.AAC.2